MVTRPVEIIDLTGNSYIRGRTFGEARREQIQACMSDWLESLRRGGMADPETYIAEMLRDTDFVPAIREYAPELLEEVQGIASGAEQQPDLLLASQLMDEEWAYRPELLSCTEPMQKCSSMAVVSRTGPTWIGQNMDLGGYTDGHQLLLRIAPHAPEVGALIFTIGGMIGLLGVNARGVGVCVNSLPQLPSAREGLPVAFVLRKLLQAGSVDEAADVVRTVPHATGQYYLIAGAARIRSFEASAATVVEYHSPDPLRVLHTNHPLAEEKGTTTSARHQANTIARLKSLTDRLMMGDPDLDVIQAALSSSDDPDHPVCRVHSADGGERSDTRSVVFTTGSMISALREGSRIVDSWVSSGPPSLRGYTQVRLPADG